MLSLACFGGSPALHGAGPSLKMGQGWTWEAVSPVLTPLSPQAQPTDMRALQDFEEPDKLHIQMNDIITVIEGRYCTGGVAGIAWGGAQTSCKLQGCQPAWGEGTPGTGRLWALAELWGAGMGKGGSVPPPAHLAAYPTGWQSCSGSPEKWVIPQAAQCRETTLVWGRGARPCLWAAQPCPYCPHRPPPLTQSTVPVGSPQPCPRETAHPRAAPR